jgi:carboxyl-terminal processing protease
VKTQDVTLRKLAGEAGTTVKITYLDAGDTEHSATLTRDALSQTDSGEIGKGLKSYALLDSKRLDSNIGYLHFTSFIEFLAPRIVSTIRSMKDAPGIVIDLRGNGGGDDSVALKMANVLFDRETQLMITKTRSGDDLYYKAKPEKDPFLGPIVILVNETSGSASEQFAAGMQASGRAYVIGRTTEGEDLDADLAKLATGAYLLYPYGQPRTPKGVVIEGRGVIPDKQVDLTRAGLLEGHDAQLDAAVEYIKSRTTK